jgi:hypothetical protein
VYGPSLSATRSAVSSAVTLRKGDASVDSKQFDELVARLASGQSRRKALQGIAGGALAAVGVTAVAESKNRKARAEGKKHKVKVQACIQSGKQCPSKKPRGKKGRKLGCDKCCQGNTTTNPQGKTVCTCRPSGTTAASACTATTAYQCCSNLCRAGRCAAY